jgi:hypothetical protein
MARHSRTRKTSPLVPRIKVWLEVGGRYAFGQGCLLARRLVERSGSIKQAVADLGKSYRHVRSRIKAAEEALGHALVETHGGYGHPAKLPYRDRSVAGGCLPRDAQLDEAGRHRRVCRSFPV